MIVFEVTHGSRQDKVVEFVEVFFRCHREDFVKFVVTKGYREPTATQAVPPEVGLKVMYQDATRIPM